MASRLLVTLALAAARARAGCSGDGARTASEPAPTPSASPTDGPSTDTPPADPLQVRRVLETSEGECPEPVQPEPAAEAVLCDADSRSYRLGPAEIVDGIDDAVAGTDLAGGAWLVTIELDDEATAAFADLTRELTGTDRQFALVLDGEVLTAPVVQSVITDGRLQIAGDFTEPEARALAEVLDG